MDFRVVAEDQGVPVPGILVAICIGYVNGVDVHFKAGSQRLVKRGLIQRVDSEKVVRHSYVP